LADIVQNEIKTRKKTSEYWKSKEKRS